MIESCGLTATDGLEGDGNIALLDSASQSVSFSRPTSSVPETTTLLGSKDNRISNLSLSSTTTAPKSKEEAVLKTLRALEGAQHQAQNERHMSSHRDVLAAISRPAPSPPTRAPAPEHRDGPKVDIRKSLGLGHAAPSGEMNEEDEHLSPLDTSASES